MRIPLKIFIIKTRIMCKHDTCKTLRKMKAAEAAGVAAILHYYQKYWVLGVGKEVGGSYKGQFNLCAGKGEPTDYVGGKFCWLECVKREFFEEFKLNAPFQNGIFDSIFRGSNGKIRFFMQGRTPIFIAVLSGISRKTITAQMKHDLANSPVAALREMSEFEWIRLDNGAQVEGKNIPVSTFAESVRKRVNVAKL